MIRKSLILVAAFVFCVGVPVAGAAGNWSIGLNGGLTIPTGDFGDKNKLDGKTGPQAGVDVSYHVTDRFAVGVDGAWVQNKHGAEGSVEDLGGGQTLTANKDKFKILRFGAHGKFMFPMADSPLQAYASAGAGVYNLKEDYEYTLAGGGLPTEVFTDESDNAQQPGSRFGGKVGLGATFKATDKVGIDLQTNYNFISLDKNKSGISSAQYIGIQAGVSFSLMQ